MMSAAAVSILVFGLYLVVNASILIVAPNFMLQLVGAPTTQEVWIRVLGVVVFILGLYYIQAGRQEVTAFFRWTTWARPLVLLAFLSFVVLGMAHPSLIGFGVVDLAGAVWTALALRRVPKAI